LLSIAPKLAFISNEESSTTLNLFGDRLPDASHEESTTTALRSALTCQLTLTKYNLTVHGGLSFIRSTSTLCHVPSNLRRLIQTTVDTVDTVGTVVEPLDVTVDLTLHGRVFSTNSLHYVLHMSAPNVTSIFPTTGSTAGGSWIRVNGYHFIDSHHTSCKFGDSKVSTEGRYLSSNAMLCRTPASEVVGSVVSVEISFNEGYSYTNSRILFHYVSGAVILSALPSSGPVAGGTNISVHVENIPTNEKMSTMYCRFSSSMDYDMLFTNNEESFMTPVTAATSTVLGSDNASQSDHLFCRSPPIESVMLLSSRGKSVNVDLVVVANGMEPQVISVNSFLFMYYGQPELFSVDPVSAPLSGGSIITLNGKGFSVLGS